MEVKFRKEKANTLRERLTVPVTENMKIKIDNLKTTEKIDFNEMVREFLSQALKKIESTSKSA